MTKIEELKRIDAELVILRRELAREEEVIEGCKARSEVIREKLGMLVARIVAISAAIK